MALRGSDVHLFPIESATLFRINAVSRNGERIPSRDRVVVSFRTDFANTAGAEYPDGLIDQSVELFLDGERFACLAELGPGRLIISSQPTPAFAGTERAQQDVSSSCAQGLCVALDDGSRLMIDPNESTRHSLEPGRITSLNGVYDQRAVMATHSCASIIADSELERPSAAALVAIPPGVDQDNWSRQIELIYRATTLHDGGFTATCTIRLQPGHLNKFNEDGWGTFECAEAPEPVRNETWWRRLLLRLGV